MRIGKWYIMRGDELSAMNLQYQTMGYEHGKEKGDSEGYKRGLYEADPWSSVGVLLKLCLEDKARAQYALIRSMDASGQCMNYDTFREALQDSIAMTDAIVAEEIRRLGGGK